MGKGKERIDMSKDNGTKPNRQQVVDDMKKKNMHQGMDRMEKHVRKIIESWRPAEQCPKCGSDNVGTTILHSFTSPRHKCFDCGYVDEVCKFKDAVATKEATFGMESISEFVVHLKIFELKYECHFDWRNGEVTKCK